MSKDLVIQVTGEPATEEGVDKLNTATLDSLRENWLPKDETVSEVLSVTENGVYDASELGVFGWHKVDVVVAGGAGAEIETDNEDGTVNTEYTRPEAGYIGTSIVTKNSETGVVTYHHVDSNGVVVSEDVPSYARVTTMPKTEYDGPDDAVDYTGCVITLYYGDGTVAAEWNGGTLTEGTAAWTSYVDATAGEIGEVVLHGRYVFLHVLPWWYEGGTELGVEYSVRAIYTVEIGDAEPEPSEPSESEEPTEPEGETEP